MTVRDGVCLAPGCCHVNISSHSPSTVWMEAWEVKDSKRGRERGEVLFFLIFLLTSLAQDTEKAFQRLIEENHPSDPHTQKIPDTAAFRSCISDT